MANHNIRDKTFLFMQLIKRTKHGLSLEHSKLSRLHIGMRLRTYISMQLELTKLNPRKNNILGIIR